MSGSNKFTPLLSPKPLSEFGAEEFRDYVKGLYFKREKRKVPPKKKKPYSFSVNKKGTLLLKVNRDPKALYDEELCLIGHVTKIPLGRITDLLKKKGIEYRKGSPPEGVVWPK